MFGMESLDVMVGIITVYLIFALACTAIVEAISTWLAIRSKNLEVALEEFLHGNITEGSSFVDAFFAHPIVQSLSKGDDGRPSYIPPKIVGQVVTELIRPTDQSLAPKDVVKQMPDDAMGVRMPTWFETLCGMPVPSATRKSNRIKGLLNSLLTEAKYDEKAFRDLLESHYDAAMDRASGWYKRKTQTIALVVSMLLVIVANVDTIKLANSLSSNPAARAKMIEIAQKQLDIAKETEKQIAQNKGATVAKPVAPATDSGGESTTPPDLIKEAKDRTDNAAKTLAAANTELTSAGIQLGWKGTYPDTVKDFVTMITNSPLKVVSKFFGLLISILAISLGAPFWFDMLNRVMQVRAAGVSPREKNPAVAGEAKK